MKEKRVGFQGLGLFINVLHGSYEFDLIECIREDKAMLDVVMIGACSVASVAAMKCAEDGLSVLIFWKKENYLGKS